VRPGGLKRDVSATFLGSIATAALGLATAAIMARTLGREGRGLLALALFIPQIIATFGRFGQDSVNSVLAGLYKDKRPHLFQQSVLTAVVAGSVGWVILSAYFFWLPIPRGEFADVPPNLVCLSALIVPISVLQALLSCLVRGTGRVVTAAILSVAEAACMLAAVAVFLGWLGQGVEGAVRIAICLPLAQILVSLWLLRDFVSLRPSDFSGEMLRRSIRMGGLTCLATLATYLVYRVDQGMLAYMTTKEELGLYVVAVGLAERLRLLPNALGAAFLPRLVNELATRQPQVPLMFRATTVLSVAAMLGVGIAGPPVIYLVFGAEFIGSIVPFLLLLPGVAALGGASILSSDLLAREEPKYSVWTSCGMLVLNLGLNRVLIPVIGIAGAAVASTVCYMSACGLAMLFYRRESGVSLRELAPHWEDVGYVWTSGLAYAKNLVGMSRRPEDADGARRG
jgi:O-antigen/teichoic acid export membrane protein